MYEQRGKHQGLYVVDKDTKAHGMITGDCRVCHGYTLVLHGLLTGSLLVEEGAEVIVHGTVEGAVMNQGVATIFGTIGSIRDLLPTASSKIDPKAVVGR